jgi:hypothetical protein
MHGDTYSKRTRRLRSALSWNTEFEQRDLSYSQDPSGFADAYLFHRMKTERSVARDFPASALNGKPCLYTTGSGLLGRPNEQE